MSKGNYKVPRVVFSKSNNYLTVQAVDDELGKTIAYLCTKELLIDGSKKNCSAARLMGSAFFSILKEKEVSKIFFDRNGYKYHGVIKEFCNVIRERGIVF